MTHGHALGQVMRGLLISMRPAQWSKNAFVLAPLVFSKHLFDAESLAAALATFGVFCGASGAVYLINDVVDIESDRVHPEKRRRPLASGIVGPGCG